MWEFLLVNKCLYGSVFICQRDIYAICIYYDVTSFNYVFSRKSACSIRHAYCRQDYSGTSIHSRSCLSMNGQCIGSKKTLEPSSTPNSVVYSRLKSIHIVTFSKLHRMRILLGSCKSRVSSPVGSQTVWIIAEALTRQSPLLGMPFLPWKEHQISQSDRSKSIRPVVLLGWWA